MTILNKILQEEQVLEVADKILKTSIEKIKNDLSTNFYNEMSSYLFEHYDNTKDSIHKQLIDEITEEFITDPKSYKFYKLREKLFNENKDFLIQILTDEQIQKTIDSIILGYFSKENHFKRNHINGIIRTINNNWEEFKKDNMFNDSLIEEIDKLKKENLSLKQKLTETSNEED